jgi:thiamine-monophosphate kinase
LTKVSDIGERELIERVMGHLTKMPGMPIPFWDDASALSLGDGRALVANTDMLVWSTDVPIGMTPYQVARKVVVMNISDLAAKGVRPLIFMPSVGLPKDYLIRDMEEAAKGFEHGAREYDAYVVGGDTNEACDVIISGVAIGVTEEARIMRRSNGSNPGDLLATTGGFGLTSCGFKHLLEGVELPPTIKNIVLNSIYMPVAKVKEGVALSSTGAVTSCIDSSDGLAISLYDLSRSTGLGYRLTKVPLHPSATEFAEYNNLDADELALYGGEEYELVFTFKSDDQVKIEDALRNVGGRLLVIGEVQQRREVTVIHNGLETPVKRRGWEHFISN